MSTRKIAAALLIVPVLLAACESSSDQGPLPPGVTTTRRPPPPAPTPEEVQVVEDCSDLVEVGELFVRNMVQALELGLPVDVLRGVVPAPAEVQTLREVADELDRRALRLGCVVGDLNREILEEVDDLESDEPVVALFLDIVRSGVIDVIP
jgi:hypothetical protein